MYKTIVYNVLYYTTYLYEKYKTYQLAFLGADNVTSIQLYDLRSLRKQCIYQQKWTDIFWAFVYRYILKNPEAFLNTLLWKNDYVSATNTELLEIKYANNQTSYSRNNHVVHIYPEQKSCFMHYALVSIGKCIHTREISLLLNHLTPLHMTAREFMMLLYMKNIIKMTELLECVLQNGISVHVVMNNLDLEERYFKDDQLILPA